MGATDQNLAAAFAGESQANRKYLFFAEKAVTEGFPQIARLFRAAAEAETVHARNHLTVMNSIATTSSNLKSAINGETFEFTEMYPGYIDQAKKDGHRPAEKSFSDANAVEQIHLTLFKKALNDLEMGSKTEERPFFVCQVCGNTVLGEAPDFCPICGTPKIKFKQVD